MPTLVERIEKIADEALSSCCYVVTKEVFVNAIRKIIDVVRTEKDIVAYEERHGGGAKRGRAEYNRAYYLKHQKEILEKRKVYRAKNIDFIKAKRKKRYEESLK